MEDLSCPLDRSFSSFWFCFSSVHYRAGPIAPAGSRTGQPSRPRPGCRAHSRIDRQNLDRAIPGRTYARGSARRIPSRCGTTRLCFQANDFRLSARTRPNRLEFLDNSTRPRRAKRSPERRGGSGLLGSYVGEPRNGGGVPVAAEVDKHSRPGIKRLLRLKVRTGPADREPSRHYIRSTSSFSIGARPSHGSNPESPMLAQVSEREEARPHSTGLFLCRLALSSR